MAQSKTQLSGAGASQAELGARGARGGESTLAHRAGHPLTKKSLTLLLQPLSRRAGFGRTPICPSVLTETYTIGFAQAGGELAALREQLGVADLVSVKRYQLFCEGTHELERDDASAVLSRY